MSINTTFFNAALKPAVANTTASFVDVGGIGDCGFRAIAAGLIDAAHSHQLSDETLKILAARYRHYFNTTASFETLIKSPESMSVLIEQLGYVVRQLAVDAMVNDVVYFRGAFINGHQEAVSPQVMRKPRTWIDETAIAAAARALNLSIKVTTLADNQPLGFATYYHRSVDVKSVVLHLQHKNQHYVPKLQNPARFAAASARCTTTIQALESIQHPELPAESMGAIRAKIAASDARLVEDFVQTRKKLEFLVMDGELTVNNLLTLYTESMPNSEYLQRYAQVSGVAHGTDHLFQAVQAHTNESALWDKPGLSHTEDLTARLIHALARAKSVGFIPEFDQKVDAMTPSPQRAFRT